MHRYLIYIPLFALVETIFQCINEYTNIPLIKIKGCQRFDGPIISMANYRSLERCLSYAKERNGLAVNFSPQDVSKSRQNKEYMASCQVLGCPDTVFMNMINDSAYDYYSFYKNLSEDSICIKSIGIFHLFHERMNYIEAINACQKIGGDLADVVSESRTNSFATLISNRLKDWHKLAYVGLDDRRKEGRFVTSRGNHLSCYKYRAWGPGQPRSKYKNEDCVLLDAERIWRVVSCKLKFPALCEIYPTVSVWEKLSENDKRDCKI